MKSRNLMLFSFMLVTLTGVSSDAGLINVDFDVDANGVAIVAPPLFQNSVNLTTLYSPLGVTFSGGVNPGDGGSILNQAGNFGVNARSGENFLAFNEFAENSLGGFATDPETLDFSVPVDSVSIFASGGSNSAEFRIEAFLGAVLVGNAQATSPGGAYSELTVSSSGAFDRVVLSELSGAIAYVYDDLSFTPTMVVPEPTSLAAFSVLLGVVGLQRSRRRREQQSTLSPAAL